MIKSLYIKNYAIIDELQIDFADGFNVFTGETGAGKSIIVGALSLLLRGRGDSSVVKSGKDKAIIEGVFSLDPNDKESIRLLQDADIDYEDEIIVRRIISSDNHNSIKINQTTVTLNFLTTLLAGNVDIHSQKDSQYLLNKKNHLELLDRFANTEKELEEYQVSFRKYKTKQQEYDDLINNAYSERELEFLRFDLDELQQANLSENEEEDLLEKEKRFKNSQKYIETLQNIIELYDGDDGIRERLYSLTKTSSIDDEKLSQIFENMTGSYYVLEENMEEIRRIYAEFISDDINIDKIEERLYLYNKLRRKYATDTKGLVKKPQELKEKIAFFDDRDFVLKEKEKELDSLRKESARLARIISDKRRKAAETLEKETVGECHDLLLNNADFSIHFEDCELNQKGIDDVEFFVSMNKGEELKPLRSVASGGEVSRLMLALKTVFTKYSSLSLVIFDEIDTGVSGKVAYAIGEKMRKIAMNCQVLTITHLAPVASFAKSHYYIYKKDTSDSSVTGIRKLGEDEIVNELALISFGNNSKTSLDAAKEMYLKAHQ